MIRRRPRDRVLIRVLNYDLDRARNSLTGWLGPGVGAGSAALAVALQPALLVPIVVTGAALGGVPVLLITTLALVAVYSPDPVRRAAAEKILDRLLTALRPPQTSWRRKSG